MRRGEPLGAEIIDRRFKSRNILIHFGEETINQLLPDVGARANISANSTANPITCYCQWASSCMGSIGVLLHESAQDSWDAIMTASDQIHPIWYSDQSLHPDHTQIAFGQSWLINGNFFPVLNWHQVHELRQQRLSDVLIYRRREDYELAPNYPEYITIADGGAVIGIERRYGDSPRSMCQEAGPIVLLAASSMFTPELVDLVLRRGWDSIHFEQLADQRSTDWVTTPAMSITSETTEPVHMVTGSSIAIHTESTGKQDPHEDTLRMPFYPNDITTTLASHDDFTTSPDSAFDRPLGTLTQASNQGINGNGKKTALSFSSVALPPVTELVCDPRTSWKCAAYEIGKRAVDIMVSVVLLIVLSPLLLAVSIMVRLTSNGPIFYQDTRQTLDGREFECLKFRTMVANASDMQQSLRKQNEVDGPQFKLSQDPRLTTIGNFLRRYNLDELPQLINVLVGDMSLVGPRPSPDHENQLCPGWRRTRLSMKSGITGLWQVLRLRDAGQSDFQEWIYYDVEYAMHRSTWLDLQILLYTPFTVFAPHWLSGFAKKLVRRGICTQSARLRHHECTSSDAN